MSVDSRFLIIMTELNDNIVTGLYLIQYLLPTTLVDKTLAASTIDRMIIDHIRIIEEGLEHHTPPSFLFSASGIFVSHRTVTDHEDSYLLVLLKSTEDQHDGHSA